MAATSLLGHPSFQRDDKRRAYQEALFQEFGSDKPRCESNTLCPPSITEGGLLIEG